MPSEPEPRMLSIAEAIREGTAEAMRENESVILYGLGVNDPGRVFGTTAGLVEEFGKERVFEVPTSENALTGIAVGAALGSLRPIVTHQRADFFYLAMDQLVNSAAKWRYMYGGQFTVPAVFRVIVGRGWGQGPTHSQTMHSWLANIPGLKVVSPSNSNDAKKLLKASIKDDNPVVFIEDRWIHEAVSAVHYTPGLDTLGALTVSREGSDVSLVAFGGMVPEALKAASLMAEVGVQAEVLDIRCLSPLDLSGIARSVIKTGHIVVIDAGHHNGSFGGNLLAAVRKRVEPKVLNRSDLITFPDFPQPTSSGANTGYYPSAREIAQVALLQLGMPESLEELLNTLGDNSSPAKRFDGPF